MLPLCTSFYLANDMWRIAGATSKPVKVTPTTILIGFWIRSLYYDHLSRTHTIRLYSTLDLRSDAGNIKALQTSQAFPARCLHNNRALLRRVQNYGLRASLEWRAGRVRLGGCRGSLLCEYISNVQLLPNALCLQPAHLSQKRHKRITYPLVNELLRNQILLGFLSEWNLVLKFEILIFEFWFRPKRFIAITEGLQWHSCFIRCPETRKQ